MGRKMLGFYSTKTFFLLSFRGLFQCCLWLNCAYSQTADVLSTDTLHVICNVYMIWGCDLCISISD